MNRSIKTLAQLTAEGRQEFHQFLMENTGMPYIERNEHPTEDAGLLEFKDAPDAEVGWTDPLLGFGLYFNINLERLSTNWETTDAANFLKELLTQHLKTTARGLTNQIYEFEERITLTPGYNLGFTVGIEIKLKSYKYPK